METNKKAFHSKRLTHIKKMPDILKVSEISAILDCSDYFVRKLIREQKICGVYCGHGFRVTKKSLLNYLEGGAA